VGCEHLCLCSATALLLLGSLLGSKVPGRGAAGLGQWWRMVESGKTLLRFTICIHSHLGPRTVAKHLDLCSRQSNPMIQVNQKLSMEVNLGLRWDQEEERRIWSLNDG